MWRKLAEPQHWNGLRQLLDPDPTSPLSGTSTVEPTRDGTLTVFESDSRKAPSKFSSLTDSPTESASVMSMTGTVGRFVGSTPCSSTLNDERLSKLQALWKGPHLEPHPCHALLRHLVKIQPHARRVVWRGPGLRLHLESAERTGSGTSRDRLSGEVEDLPTHQDWPRMDWPKLDWPKLVKSGWPKRDWPKSVPSVHTTTPTCGSTSATFLGSQRMDLSHTLPRSGWV